MKNKSPFSFCFHIFYPLVIVLSCIFETAFDVLVLCVLLRIPDAVDKTLQTVAYTALLLAAWTKPTFES